MSSDMNMAESDKSLFTGLLLLLTNVLLAVLRFFFTFKYFIHALFQQLNFQFPSGVFSGSSPALSVTSAVLATIVIATSKYR